MSNAECFLSLTDDKDEMTVWTLESGLLGIRVHEFNGGTYGVDLSLGDAIRLRNALEIWCMVREE
jgi:hypothetical protein